MPLTPAALAGAASDARATAPASADATCSEFDRFDIPCSPDGWLRTEPGSNTNRDPLDGSLSPAGGSPARVMPARGTLIRQVRSPTVESYAPEDGMGRAPP